MKDIPSLFSDWQKMMLIIFPTLALLIPALADARSMTDQELLLAAETRLAKDPGVSDHLIDVTVKDGVVTLSGTIDNALGADRATRVTENIRGVRSVVNTVEVRTPDRPAEEIRADVTAALERSPAPNVRAIEISAAQGVATLEGTVNSWREKWLAEQKAKSIRGVKGVRNNLEIAYDAERADDDIRKDIETTLRWDAWLHGTDLKVAVNDGKVELSGSVASALQRRRAKADAWVNGVHKVDAEGVKVAPEGSDGADSISLSKAFPEADDESTTQALRRAFALDPRIDAEAIEIDVKDGVATLDGRVDRAGTRRALSETARATRGVWIVRNNVGIRPGMIPTREPMVEGDSRFAQRVRTALLAHADVHQHEIGVEVDSGVAELTGTVDSDHQKQAAEQVVSEIRGVVRVANRLEVAEEDRPQKSDDAIREEIRSELFWSPFVDREDITVTVRGGVATLAGVVDTLEARRAATKNARDGGAVEVRNRLRVRVGPAYYQP